MNLTWKTVPSFPHLQASSRGDIRTVDRVISMKNNSKRLVQGIVKKKRIWDGYYYITFALKGKFYSRRVGRLVAEAFLGSSKLVVNHKNCKKLDDRIENLEWVTISQNTIHAYENGLITHNQKRGWHTRTKIQQKQFPEIFRLKKLGLLNREIAKKFGVSQTIITDILNKNTKKQGRVSKPFKGKKK